MKVLLTGASGFVAAHVLDLLLERGHSVVATVRSEEKARQIKAKYACHSQERLAFTIVEDVARPDAFDEAVTSDPPIEAVIHTASPFSYSFSDVQKQLLEPAIKGTTGVLKSIKKNAPSVRRVVITSSFAAMVNASKGLWPEHTFSEKDWNPVTLEEALKDSAMGYRASKTFAEKAAWDFVANEKPNFTLSTLCPPMIFGPIAHHLESLDSLNTSNQRIRDCILGAWRDEIPPTVTFLCVDVRDVALCHVLAMEKDVAANKRYLVTAGHFCNRMIADAVKQSYPDLREKLPTGKAEGGLMPSEIFKVDTSPVEDDLGMQWRLFEDSITDTVRSLKGYI